MKVSVVTVVYNGVADIENTILSVLQQKYDDYEYIVVDGASTDGTVDIICRYDQHITQWISEPDNGIYNAMNKAVRMAQGEYCIFMNAGDRFATPLALEAASLFFSYGFDVLTGCEICTKHGKVIDYVKPLEQITMNHFYVSSISHQSSFIKRSLLLEYPYDENLQLVSDWKFWIQTLILRDKTYRAINVDISLFNHDGITYLKKEIGIKEREQVFRELIPNLIYIDYVKMNKHNRLRKVCQRVLSKLKRIFRSEIQKYRMRSIGDYFITLC